jgi:hypothetical protein
MSWALKKLGGYLTVDKTLIVRWIINNPNKKIVITRPHGWGKSFNMEIIEEFFGFPIKNGEIFIQDFRLKSRLFLGDERIKDRVGFPNI